MSEKLRIHSSKDAYDERTNACRRLEAQEDLDALFVDLLTEMTSSDSFQSAEDEMADVIRKLQRLARDLGIAVVAATPLVSALPQCTDRRPGLADLRHAGVVGELVDMPRDRRGHFILEFALPADTKLNSETRCHAWPVPQQPCRPRPRRHRTLRETGGLTVSHIASETEHRTPPFTFSYAPYYR